MRLSPIQRELFSLRPRLERPRSQAIDTPPATWWWRALRQHSLLLAATVLLALAAGIGATRAMLPVYRASAAVAVHLAPPGIELGPSRQPAFNTGGDTEMQTVAEELGSRALIAPVAAHLGAAITTSFWRRPPRPVIEPADLTSTALAQLQIAVVPHSRIVQLQFLAPNPALAARFLDHLLAAYARVERTREQRIWLGQEQSLAAQATGVLDRMQQEQSALVQLAARHGLANPASQLTLASRRWQQLASAETSAEIAQEQQQAALAQTSPSALSPSTAPPLDLELQRAALQVKIAALAARYQPQAPPLREARQQLDALNQSLREFRDENRRASEHALAAERQQIRALQTSLQRQTGRQTELQAALDQFDNASQQLQADQKAYASLLDQIHQDASAAGTAAAPVQIVDRPLAGSRPLRPNLPYTLAYALLLGGLVGAATAGSLEYFRPRLALPAAAELGVPLVAALPRQAPAGSARAWRQSIATCVAALLRAQSESGTRVVLVASSARGEGKTRFAAELASQLGRVASSVLVLDGNANAAGLHREFGGQASPGLAELLAGGVETDQVVQHHPEIGALSYIAAGTPADDDDAAMTIHLASHAVSDLLTSARQRYEWIVIDGIALADGPQAALWASLADVCLLVADPRHSTARQVRQALDELETSGAPELGLVLHGVPVPRRVRLPAPWLAQGRNAVPEVAHLRQRA